MNYDCDDSYRMIKNKLDEKRNCIPKCLFCIGPTGRLFKSSKE